MNRRQPLTLTLQSNDNREEVHKRTLEVPVACNSSLKRVTLVDLGEVKSSRVVKFVRTPFLRCVCF